MFRGWMIFKRNEPLYYTLHKFRPAAWQAWEQHERPKPNFDYGVSAKRVRITVEERA